LADKGRYRYLSLPSIDSVLAQAITPNEEEVSHSLLNAPLGIGGRRHGATRHSSDVGTLSVATATTTAMAVIVIATTTAATAATAVAVLAVMATTTAAAATAATA